MSRTRILKRALVFPLIMFLTIVENVFWLVTGDRFRYGTRMNKLAKWVKK